MKIVCRHLRKRFLTMRGVVEAVKDLSLEVEKGEFFVFLGPSGCGKSTLLNLTAGLEKPTDGEILFNDRIVAAPKKKIFIPPRERNVAMVFQSYALYPHLNVFENIAFPLRVSKEKDREINKSVQEVSTMLGIRDLMERKPGELSGGQRQRVSIARAIVRRPDVFLLDEPLSNLDAQLRMSTRGELKRLQRELEVTTLYVTHDQTEAMTLGDRVAVLKDGFLVQVGTPAELYEKPKSSFVATFIGSPPMNLILAQVKQEEERVILSFDDVSVVLPPEQTEKIRGMAKEDVLMGIRPEHVTLLEQERESTYSGRLSSIEPLGRETLLRIRTGQKEVVALSSHKHYHLNETVRFFFEPGRIHLFDY